MAQCFAWMGLDLFVKGGLRIYLKLFAPFTLIHGRLVFELWINYFPRLSAWPSPLVVAMYFSPIVEVVNICKSSTSHSHPKFKLNCLEKWLIAPTIANPLSSLKWLVDFEQYEWLVGGIIFCCQRFLKQGFSNWHRTLILLLLDGSFLIRSLWWIFIWNVRVIEAWKFRWHAKIIQIRWSFGHHNSLSVVDTWCVFVLHN